MTNWKEILQKLKDNKNLSLDDYTLSTDEKELIDDIIRANTLNESLEILSEIDVDKEWKSQRVYLQQSELTFPKQVGHFKRHLFKYAAAILLPLFVFGTYYIDNTSFFSTPLEDYSFSTISHSNPVLILADGSEKQLESLDSNLMSMIFETEKERLNDKITVDGTSVDFEYNTLVIPRGVSYKVQLADGTNVHLNENTVFKFPANFQKMAQRKVILEKGEVFFNVVKDSEKAFVVSIGSVDIAVLGTSFNVQLTDEYLSTTLIEGKVKLSNEKNEVFLMPNQQALINHQNKDIMIMDVDVSSAMAWHNKLWVFEQKTLESVMRDLTSWYNFEYQFVDEETKYLTYTASLEKTDSIENVLHLLEKTEKVYFTIKRNKIFIHKVKSPKLL